MKLPEVLFGRPIVLALVAMCANSWFPKAFRICLCLGSKQNLSIIASLFEAAGNVEIYKILKASHVGWTDSFSSEDTDSGNGKREKWGIAYNSSMRFCVSFSAI